MEVATNTTNDGTRKTMTKVANDVKTRAQLCTSHLKGLSGTLEALKFILMQCWSKAPTNENVDFVMEKVNSLVGLDVTEFLPNNVEIATKDVTKLGVMNWSLQQMKLIIVCGVKELIHNVEDKFLI